MDEKNIRLELYCHYSADEKSPAAQSIIESVFCSYLKSEFSRRRHADILLEKSHAHNYNE